LIADSLDSTLAVETLGRPKRVITPADSESVAQLQDLILSFQVRYERAAKPFNWKFTRTDLLAELGGVTLAPKLMKLTT
jgi:hypothetical protein